MHGDGNKWPAIVLDRWRWRSYGRRRLDDVALRRLTLRHPAERGRIWSFALFLRTLSAWTSTVRASCGSTRPSRAASASTLASFAHRTSLLSLIAAMLQQSYPRTFTRARGAPLADKHEPSRVCRSPGVTAASST